MKSIALGLCLILAIASTSETFGQFNRGRWLAGGSVSMTTSSSDRDINGTTLKSRSTSFTLGPQAGYFVMDRFAVGTTLSFTLSGSNGNTMDATGVVDYNTSGTSITLGPFVRYYLPASIFFQVNGEYGIGKFKSKFGTVENSDGNSKWFNYGAAVGYAYFLNDYVAIEPTFGYRSTGSIINDNSSRVGNLYLNAAFTIYLGERK